MTIEDTDDGDELTLFICKLWYLLCIYILYVFNDVNNNNNDNNKILRTTFSIWTKHKMLSLALLWQLSSLDEWILEFRQR